jgi:hypothetical protein
MLPVYPALPRSRRTYTPTPPARRRSQGHTGGYSSGISTSSSAARRSPKQYDVIGRLDLDATAPQKVEQLFRRLAPQGAAGELMAIAFDGIDYLVWPQRDDGAAGGLWCPTFD